MKRWKSAVPWLTVLVVSPLAVTLSMAQQTPSIDTPSIDTSSAAPSTFIEQQEPGQIRSSDVVGATVSDAAQQELGEIDELIVDSSGKVTAAVVSVGGFLGIGDKKVAVPWESVQVSGDQVVVAQLSKEQLDVAPPFRTQAEMEAERARASRIENARQAPANSPPGTGAPSGDGGSTF